MPDGASIPAPDTALLSLPTKPRHLRPGPRGLHEPGHEDTSMSSMGVRNNLRDRIQRDSVRLYIKDELTTCGRSTLSTHSGVISTRMPWSRACRALIERLRQIAALANCGLSAYGVAAARTKEPFVNDRAEIGNTYRRPREVPNKRASAPFSIGLRCLRAPKVAAMMESGQQALRQHRVAHPVAVVSLVPCPRARAQPQGDVHDDDRESGSTRCGSHGGLNRQR